MNTLVEVDVAALDGKALSWAVAYAVFGKPTEWQNMYQVDRLGDDKQLAILKPGYNMPHGGIAWEPIHDGNQGVELMRRYNVDLMTAPDGWAAHLFNNVDDQIDCVTGKGPYPLVAVCRAVAAYYFGRKATVPAMFV